MSEDPRPPDSFPAGASHAHPSAAQSNLIDPDQKGDLHIAGAGTIGMALLILSLSVLFIASMLAYLLIRHQVTAQPPFTWPPPGLPRVPNSLWLSTAVILAASVTIQRALNAVRRDDDRRLVRSLTTTFIIGVLFLMLQTLNWFEFYHALGQTAV